jgi:hypothetical protein
MWQVQVADSSCNLTLHQTPAAGSGGLRQLPGHQEGQGRL